MECGVSSSGSGVDDGQVVRPGEGTLMPKSGMVNQVCREWLVHEDSALAYRLQEKEIEMHYGKNRHNRKLVRTDLVQAMNLQLEENTEATSYEQSVTSLELQDERLAKKLQEELEEEAMAKIKSLEIADKEIAKELQQKESQQEPEVVFNKKLHKPYKTKISAVNAAAAAPSSSLSSTVSSHHQKKTSSRRELHQPACSMDEDSVSTRKFSSTMVENGDRSSRRKESARLALQASRSLDRTPNYLTMPPTLSSPTAAVTEDEMRLIQEEDDERLARLLQEQESLQKSSQSYRDQQLAIEVQDRELARLLQEQERARAKKARHKNHKAKVAGEQTQLVVKGESKRSTSSGRSHSQHTSQAVIHSDSSEACSSSGSHGSGSEMHRKPVRPTNLSVSSSYSQESRLELPPRHREPSSNRESPHSTTFNVATAIDPTYRRSHSNDRLVHELPSSSPILPTPVSIRSGSLEGGVYHEEEDEDDNEYDQLDEDHAPPYMPIQGQKRTPSEKQRKKKESCKQQ